MLSFLSTWSSVNLNPNTPSQSRDPRKAGASKAGAEVKFKALGGFVHHRHGACGGFLVWDFSLLSCLAPQSCGEEGQGNI